MRLIRPAGCFGSERTEEPILHGIGQVLAAVELYRAHADPFHELLVAVSGMELHKPQRVFAATGQHQGQAAGHVRLAGPWHALKDDLTFEVEQVAGTPQPAWIQKGSATE